MLNLLLRRFFSEHFPFHFYNFFFFFSPLGSCLASSDISKSDFSTLQQYFRAVIVERKLEENLYNVCHLIARMLYQNYADFLPKTSQQIAALFFLLSVYDRRNNPFLGFVFDIIVSFTTNFILNFS